MNSTLTPKRIYLAGPMRGIPEFNFPRFNAVAAALRANGHEVFNPAEKDIERHGGVNISAGNANGDVDRARQEHGFSLRQALHDDFTYICKTANCLCLLPGWEHSGGSRAEHAVASALTYEGMEIMYLHEDLVRLMERAAELQDA